MQDLSVPEVLTLAHQLQRPVDKRRGGKTPTASSTGRLPFRARSHTIRSNFLRSALAREYALRRRARWCQNPGAWAVRKLAYYNNKFNPIYRSAIRAPRK